MGIITPRAAGGGGEPAKVSTTIAGYYSDMPVINPAGTKLYALDGGGSNLIKAINIASDTITKSMTSTITLGGPLGISLNGDTLYAMTGNGANDSTSPTFSLATETQQVGTNWYAANVGWPGGFFAKNSTSLYALYSWGSWSTGRFYSYVTTLSGTGGGQLPVGDNVAGTGAMLARSIAATDSKIYVFGNYVYSIDIATWTLSSSLGYMGGGNNWSCAINPAKTKIYLSYGSNELKVFSTSTNTITGTITSNTFSSPYGITFNNAGTKAYAANYGVNADGNYYISVIDTATDTVTGKIRTVTSSPTRVAITPDDKKLYATSIYGMDVIVGAGFPSTNLEVPTPLVRSSVR